VRGTAYRAVGYAPLRPWQVRRRRFPRTGWGRRGLDPVEVELFLDRVAGDLANLYDALAESRAETQRVKDALRQWQSAQARLADNAAAGYR
jgi:DivIVA domain-containing protein